jgi:hypothetical protein
VLPRGGSSMRYNAIKHLEQFVETHSENWYNFAEEATLEQIDELYVVVGVQHATSWALTSYSSESSSVSFSLGLQVAAVAGVDGSYTPFWEGSMPCDRRFCDVEQLKVDARQNQAIFVNTVRIRDRNRFRLKLWSKNAKGLSLVPAKGSGTDGREDTSPQGGSGPPLQFGGTNQSFFGPNSSDPSPSPSYGVDHNESSSQLSDASSIFTSCSTPSEYFSSEEATSSESDDPEMNSDPDLLVSFRRCE